MSTKISILEWQRTASGLFRWNRGYLNAEMHPFENYFKSWRLKPNWVKLYAHAFIITSSILQFINAIPKPPNLSMCGARPNAHLLSEPHHSGDENRRTCQLGQQTGSVLCCGVMCSDVSFEPYIREKKLKSRRPSTGEGLLWRAVTFIFIGNGK